jgi:uncharacterized membrane protein YfcA
MSLLDILGFGLFGLVVGAYGTLIGAGGGFIIVPVLVLGLGWEHTTAAATSLFAVMCNAASGSFAYWRQRRIDFKTGLPFALATLPGAVLGPFVASAISGRVFNIIFGILLVLVSIYLILRPERKAVAPGTVPERPTGWRGWGWTPRRFIDAKGEEWRYGFSQPIGLLISVGVGFLSSLLGIGGGIVHVPAMVMVLGFPAHIATATSHFILAISSATGTAVNLGLGRVQLGPALAMGIGAIGGAQIGGRLAQRIHGRWIVRGLAIALGLVGLRLLLPG